MKYFTDCTTAEQLKATYRNLTKMYHPDINRTPNATAIMQEINAQYDAAFARLKDVHANADGDIYTASTPTSEAPEEFRAIIEALLRMGDSVTVELCGRWIWISGDTKPHKDTLKNIGCRWASKKMMWSWHAPQDAVYTHRTHSMDYIRNTYGSEKYGKSADVATLPAT